MTNKRGVDMATTTQTIYDFTATANNGTTFDFSKLSGHPILVVNTASKCGFTPQYAGLEQLYKEYKDKGLVIIAFPCDQFAHQEPGDDVKIAEFCQINFGVTFPIMAKIDVNGKNTHPVFAWLKDQTPGAFGSGVKWNFTKFLVARDGKTVTRFAPTVEPVAMKSAIEQVL
jgi:glutathione peroxidase